MLPKSIRDANFCKAQFERNGIAETALMLEDGITDPCGALQLCNKKVVIPTTSNKHKTASESRSSCTYIWTLAADTMSEVR